MIISIITSVYRSLWNASPLFTLLSVPLVSGLILVACSPDGGTGPARDSEGAGERLTVVTTLYPLQFLAQKVGGDRVRVVNLTPTGVEPHDWQPGARDIISILEADLFTYNGTGFEPWVDRVLEKAHENQILNATDSLRQGLSSGEGQGFVDPHVWLDPGLYLKQAVAVKQALAAIDPEGAAQYSENLASLEQDMNVLEAEMEKALSACALNVFVINHASFGYLARRFGLEQLSISGLSPEAEASPARLRGLVNQIEDSGIGYVFFESLVSPRIAETLANEVGAQTLELNPLAGLTSEEQYAGEDYFSVMRSNLDNLKKALQCR